jgi:hypothetical protein
MRSPWQLIKSFASRRKKEDASELAEVVSTPEARAEELRPEVTRQAELEASPEKKHKPTFVENEASVQAARGGAAAELPAPSKNSAPLRTVAAEDASERPERLARGLPAIRPVEGEAGLEVVEGGSQDKSIKANLAKNLREPTLLTESLPQPAVTATKTPLEEIAGLDLQIRNLRLQLCAKLEEQNSKLRQLLLRYDSR